MEFNDLDMMRVGDLVDVMVVTTRRNNFTIKNMTCCLNNKHIQRVHDFAFLFLMS